MTETQCEERKLRMWCLMEDFTCRPLWERCVLNAGHAGEHRFPMCETEISRSTEAILKANQ